MESPSGKVGLDSWAFPLTTESFERADQVVASNPGLSFWILSHSIGENLQSCDTKSGKPGFEVNQIVACPITGAAPCLCGC